MMKYTLFLVILIISVGCKGFKMKHARTIIFPTHAVFTIQGDTVDFCTDSAHHKILVFVDSIGCVSCKFQIPLWKRFMKQISEQSDNLVSCLFYFESKDTEYLNSLFTRSGFYYPVCLDTLGTLYKLNNFSRKDGIHVFLLNQKNQILIEGNPVRNMKLKNKYLSFFSDRKLNERVVKRNAKVRLERSVLNWEPFDWNQEKEDSIVIINISTIPFSVRSIVYNSNCLNTIYSKKSIIQGEQLVIGIQYKAKQSKSIKETLYIYGNVENMPIIIKVYGEAR